MIFDIQFRQTASIDQSKLGSPADLSQPGEMICILLKYEFFFNLFGNAGKKDQEVKMIKSASGIDAYQVGFFRSSADKLNSNWWS